MTEYEYADAISSYAVQGGTFFTIWITILSAYGIVAYTVGKNLSSSQIAWLNTLYIFAACMTIIGFFGSWGTQIYYIEKIRELNPESPQAVSNTIKNTIIINV